MTTVQVPDKELQTTTEALKDYLARNDAHYSEVVEDVSMYNGVDSGNDQATYIVITLTPKTKSWDTNRLMTFLSEKVMPIDRKIHDFFVEKESDVFYYINYR